ncbi:unnamed protein product, partial [Symbiodinium sp. CCMP2456]
AGGFCGSPGGGPAAHVDYLQRGHQCLRGWQRVGMGAGAFARVPVCRPGAHLAALPSRPERL